MLTFFSNLVGVKADKAMQAGVEALVRWDHPEHGLLLPAAALVGAAFLVLADLLARSILPPTEIPVGILTALVGGPFFLWLLRRERRDRLTVRAAQLAILIVCLILWEILPRLQIVNPLFTSYPSAIWPTFLEMLSATPQQASILTHTWATVLATVIGFTAAMLLGTVIAATLWWWDGLYKVLDPYLVVANAMPKTAFVPIFYIWLGATLFDQRGDLAVELRDIESEREEHQQGAAGNEIAHAPSADSPLAALVFRGILFRRRPASTTHQSRCLVTRLTPSRLLIQIRYCL